MIYYLCLYNVSSYLFRYKLYILFICLIHLRIYFCVYTDIGLQIFFIYLSNMPLFVIVNIEKIFIYINDHVVN